MKNKFVLPALLIVALSLSACVPQMPDGARYEVRHIHGANNVTVYRVVRAPSAYHGAMNLELTDGSTITVMGDVTVRKLP